MRLNIISLLLLTSCYTIEKDDLHRLIVASYRLGCEENSNKTEAQCLELAEKFKDRAIKVIVK
jgi:hypothetical protein